MAVEPNYALTLDHSRWLPVPLAFPWGEFETPADWADALAASLLTGTGAEQAGTRLLADTALALQAMDSPLPGAAERFWRTEYVGGRPIVAHLYITETEAASVDDALQLARAGIGGSVQTWSILDETAFDAAISVAVVAEIADQTIMATRWIGLRGGLVFLLDHIDEDPLVLEAVQPELGAVFRSIRFA